MAVTLHKAGESRARALIRDGKYDAEGAWSFSAGDGDKLLGENGDDWQAYADAHLGEDTSASENTKERWKYPVIKDGKVYASALRAADSRAGQQGATEIQDAAKRLLEELDKKEGKKPPDEPRASASPAHPAAAPAIEVRRLQSPVRMMPDTLDEDSREVDVDVSAGSPVRRTDWETGRDYMEELSMEPSAIRLGRLNRGAPLLDSHDYFSGTRAILGAVVPGTARVEDGRLRARVRFSRSPDGERAFQDMRDGVLRNVSVGYLTHRSEVDRTTDPETRTAVDWEPHEVSAVAIPADPRAGFRGMDSSPTAHKEHMMTKPAQAEGNSAAATEAEIQARADALVKAEFDRRDAITAIARKLGLPDDFARKHIDAKTRLDDFRALAIDEKATSEASAGPLGVTGDGWEGRDFGMPEILPPSARRTPEPGQAAAQMVMAVAAGRRMGVSPLDIARARRDIIPAAVRALQASVGSTGGFMIPVELSTEIIEFLRPRTVVRKAMPAGREISLPRGNLTIGRQNTGATVGYVGEGQSTAYTQESMGEITLQARKAKAIVPISNDLIRFAQSSADMVVRDDLVRQLAVLEDQNFLRGVGSAFAPKGMRYLATSSNVLAATLSYNVSTVIADLQGMVVTLQNAYIPMTNPHWFWSPKTHNYLYDARDSVGGFLFRDEMDRGMFRGIPFSWTQNIPSNLGGSANQSEIYLIDMDEFIIGDVPGLMIDASQEASYSSDGSTLTNSAFDRDETVIRIIAEHDCNIKHTASACILTGVPYGN